MWQNENCVCENDMHLYWLKGADQISLKSQVCGYMYVIGTIKPMSVCWLGYIANSLYLLQAEFHFFYNHSPYGSFIHYTFHRLLIVLGDLSILETDFTVLHLHCTAYMHNGTRAQPSAHLLLWALLWEQCYRALWLIISLPICILSRDMAHFDWCAALIARKHRVLKRLDC